jgi:hypothetical protein
MAAGDFRDRLLACLGGDWPEASPLETIRRAYQSMHADDKFTAFIEYGAGHVLSDAMWSRVKAHFDKHLRAA